jgi:hypothetical protein
MSAITHAQPVPQPSQLDPQEYSPAVCQCRAAFLPSLYPVERQVIAEATKADVLATSAPYVPGAPIEHQAARGGLAVCVRAIQARPGALSTPPIDDVSWRQVSARSLPFESF